MTSKDGDIKVDARLFRACVAPISGHGDPSREDDCRPESGNLSICKIAGALTKTFQNIEGCCALVEVLDHEVAPWVVELIVDEDPSSGETRGPHSGRPIRTRLAVAPVVKL